jgi:hypothetical protein
LIRLQFNLGVKRPLSNIHSATPSDCSWPARDLRPKGRNRPEAEARCSPKWTLETEKADIAYRQSSAVRMPYGPAFADREIRQQLKRALSASRRGTQHVRVDHRRTYVGVPEQLLQESDVDPGVEQVRRERMPQGVCGDFLRDLRSRYPMRDRASDALLTPCRWGGASGETG